jgi:hypothetical protein
MAASVYSSGDMSASYLFEVGYKVNVTSSGFGQKKPRHRLLVDRVIFPGTLYTYAVPSSKTGSFLRLYSQLPDGVSTSLLESSSARVFIEGSYAGTTNFEAVKSGGDVRVNLGENRNVEITTTTVVPLNDKLVEDKSTWFVKDTEKFRVKTEEVLFSVRNLHAPTTGDCKNDILVVLAENLPKSSDTDITVELMSPTKQEVATSLQAVQNVLGAKLKSTVRNQQDIGQLKASIEAFASNSTVQGEGFLSALIYSATQLRYSAASEVGGRSSPNSLYTFVNKNTNTVYWMKWLPGGESFACSYKYRILWPEDKPSIMVK